MMAIKTITLPDSTQLITADADELRWAVLAAPVSAAQLLANSKSRIDEATSAVEALEQELRAPTVRFADEIPSEHPDIPTLVPALLGDTDVRVAVDHDLCMVDFRDVAGDEVGAFVRTGQDLVEALTAEARARIAYHREIIATHQTTVSAVEADPRRDWRVVRWSATEESALWLQGVLSKRAAPGEIFTVVEAALS